MTLWSLKTTLFSTDSMFNIGAATYHKADESRLKVSLWGRSPLWLHCKVQRIAICHRKHRKDVASGTKHESRRQQRSLRRIKPLPSMQSQYNKGRVVRILGSDTPNLETCLLFRKPQGPVHKPKNRHDA